MLILAIFISLVVMICGNVPIAVALAISAIIGLVATEGTDALVTVALDMYDGSTKFSLIAIPMFVLAGAIMNSAGITDRLINFVSALIGFVRGGLAMVNIYFVAVLLAVLILSTYVPAVPMFLVEQFYP